MKKTKKPKKTDVPRPLNIVCEEHPRLSQYEVQHCFRTLLTLTGISLRFVSTGKANDDVDIYYDAADKIRAALTIGSREMNLADSLPSLKRTVVTNSEKTFQGVTDLNQYIVILGQMGFVGPRRSAVARRRQAIPQDVVQTGATGG